MFLKNEFLLNAYYMQLWFQGLVKQNGVSVLDDTF